MARYIVLVNKLPQGIEPGVYGRVKKGNLIHSFTSNLNPTTFSKESVGGAVATAKKFAAVAAPLSIPFFKKKTDAEPSTKFSEFEESLIESTSKLLYTEGYNELIKIDEPVSDWPFDCIALKNEYLNNNYNL